MDFPFSNEYELLMKLTDYLDLGTRDVELTQDEKARFESLGTEIADRFDISEASVYATFQDTLAERGIAEDAFGKMSAEDRNDCFKEAFSSILDSIKAESPDFGIEIGHNEELVARYQQAYMDVIVEKIPAKLEVVDAEVDSLKGQLDEAKRNCEAIDPDVHPAYPDFMSREEQESMHSDAQSRVEDLTERYEEKLEEQKSYLELSDRAVPFAIDSDKPVDERLEELRAHADEFGIDRNEVEGISPEDRVDQQENSANDTAGSDSNQNTDAEQPKDVDEKAQDTLNDIFGDKGEDKYKELSKAYNGDSAKMADTADYLKKWQSGAYHSHVDNAEDALKSKIEYDTGKSNLEYLSGRTKFRNTFTVAQRLSVDIAAYKTGLPGANGKPVNGGDIAIGILELSRTNIVESVLEIVIYAIFEKIAPAVAPEKDVSKDDPNNVDHTKHDTTQNEKGSPVDIQGDKSAAVSSDQHGDNFCGVDFSNTDSRYARVFNNDYISRNVPSYQNLGTDLSGDKNVRVCDMRVITYKGNSYAVDPFGKATAIDIGNEKHLIAGTDKGFVTVEKWDSLRGDRLEAVVANANNGSVRDVHGGTVEAIKAQISENAFEKFFSKIGGGIVDKHISTTSERIETISSIEKRIESLESAKGFYKSEAAAEKDDAKRGQIEAKIEEIDKVKGSLEKALSDSPSKAEFNDTKERLEAAKEHLTSGDSKTDEAKYEKMQTLVEAEKTGHGVSRTDSPDLKKGDLEKFESISTDFGKDVDSKVEALKDQIDAKIEKLEELRSSVEWDRSNAADQSVAEKLDAQIEKYNKAVEAYGDAKDSLDVPKNASVEEKLDAIKEADTKISGADETSDKAVKDDISSKIESVKNDLSAIKETLVENHDGSHATDVAIERIEVAEKIVDSDLGDAQKFGSLERAIEASSDTDLVSRNTLSDIGVTLGEAEDIDVNANSALTVEDIKDMLVKAIDQGADGTFSMSDYIKENPGNIDPDRFAEACKDVIKEKIEDSKAAKEDVMDEDMQSRIADVVSDCIDAFTQICDDPIMAQDMACECLEKIFSDDLDSSAEEIFDKIVENRELEVSERPDFLESMQSGLNDIDSALDAMDDPMSREEIMNMLTDVFGSVRDAFSDNQKDFSNEDTAPKDIDTQPNDQPDYYNDPSSLNVDPDSFEDLNKLVSADPIPDEDKGIDLEDSPDEFAPQDFSPDDYNSYNDFDADFDSGEAAALG